MALGNAHRHGLTVPIRADPRWRAAVVVLERELVIEAPAARRFAGMAAEGVMELRRIAQARAALMGRLEGDAEIDALRRLARYEGLAYAKKDKGLRVIAAHRLVRDCAAALRCCRNVAIRKTTACETPANSEAPDPAARPAGDRHELCHRTRRPCHALIRDRRAARGAIDPASAEALTEALLAFDADGSQSVAVPWGAGGAFCAGFDLKYAAGLTGERRLRSRRRDRAARRSETPHQCAVAERRVAVRWATSQCQIADTHPISSITRANTRSIAGVRSPP